MQNKDKKNTNCKNKLFIGFVIGMLLLLPGKYTAANDFAGWTDRHREEVWLVFTGTSWADMEELIDVEYICAGIPEAFKEKILEHEVCGY